MEIVYETPNKTWRVYKETNDHWIDFFREDVSWFVIGKQDGEFFSEYKSIQIEYSIEDVFKWLKNHNIISNDEMKFELKKYA